MNLWGKHLINTWIRYPTGSGFHGYLSYCFLCKGPKQLIALYYWLRTYLLEHLDVANKSEMGRGTVTAQQRVQQIPSSVARSASLNSVESNPTASNPCASNLNSDVVNNQGQHRSVLTVSHDGSNPQGQESDRAQNIDGNIPAGSESSQTNSAGLNDSQGGFRRNAGLSWGASAVTAFDAAKDVMEALRNKHTNLASLPYRNWLQVCSFA
eukprot:Gb_02842 [translate_table: standard]